MNFVHPDHAFRTARADADTFLRWAEGREGRHELAGGLITVMTGASKNHAIIMVRIAALLLGQLDQSLWQVCAADLAVKTKAGVRYPDIVMDAAQPGAGSSLSAAAPIFIAEVLSPSSIAIDMVEKPAEYGALSSLRAYAVFSQDEPRVWLWLKGDDGWPSKPEMSADADASLPIPALGITLPLGPIYQGIGPERQRLTD